jgi:hypothetical protein
MNKKKLAKILEEHKKWVNGEGGKRANLRNADLRNTDLHEVNLWNANLRGTNMRGANMRGADLRCANLRGADLRNADLSDADLWNADLSNAKLRGADLRGADVDYAAWSLSCNSLRVIVDDRIASQLAYHLLSVCDYSGIRIDDLRELANKFHRVEECGKLEWPEEQIQ